MLEIFSENPWLVAVAEIALVVLVGIVCISFNVCRRKIRLAQFDFELKRDMLQRGMSAADIHTVIEAGRPRWRCRPRRNDPSVELANARGACHAV